MKTNKPAKLLALLALAALLPASATIITFYDFNDVNNLGWNGITADTSTATWSSTGGLGGSGGVLSGGTGDRTRMITTQTTFDGSLGELSIGMFFNANSSNSSGDTDDRASHIGFKDNNLAGQTRNADPGIRFDQADNAVSARLASSGLGDNTNKQLDLFTIGDTARATSGEFFLEAGDWYFWSANFTPTSDGVWDLTTSINTVDQTTFDIGSMVTGATVSATGITGPTFANFSEIWGGIALAPDRTDRGTFNAIDNATITAIPEPGTLVLVGIALGSLFLFRRRR
ncbi:MAG: PEP-CTERM sorting domain-containing protein [Verrucomicrobia bacterium]|nr:PEP-CTERM sorting domain-containing protein [Verrucomicrobiota bacterium]MCH8512716.1 PEP-CTERM sorting domain-containing protein [Kiritimatiellia bacterium]